jgi:putative flippase GtrA
VSQPVNVSLASEPAKARSRVRWPFRYLVAAGMNTAFGFAIYPALLWAFPWLRVHYMIGLFIAQALSLSFAYANYKLGVFQTRGGYAREVTAFVSFYGVNYAANWVALPALVELGRVPPIVAQLIFCAVIMITSYFWHSKVTFRGAR